MVQRLSKAALQKFMSGKVKEPVSVAVKFYGNDCHYCHALKTEYESLSKEYSDVKFYAFNVADYPAVTHILQFQGVPTICFMKVGSNQPRIKIMPEPADPNRVTWYTTEDIKSFIDKEK
jgi:thiol-disulfide isomerase/thioredoxin